MNKQELYDIILNKLNNFSYISPDSIPDINLYMDQMTTFMDEKLKSAKRFDDDKILTKTMINNYAKNKLLPSPDKKKYSKDHILLLIFIYYFKNVLSFSDIEGIFEPLTSKYFSEQDSNINLEKIYTKISKLEKKSFHEIKNDIFSKLETSSVLFDDADEDDAEYLALFTFICDLIFDIYVKKHLLESIADEINSKKTKKKK